MALLRGTRRLHAICGHLAIGTFIWGYNVGVLSSVLVHPGWRASLHDPSPSRKGLITGIYYLGALFSYLLISHPVADVFGRKYAAMYGTVVLCMGAVLMASAASLPSMLFGRALCGVGAGVVSTSVPLYQRFSISSPTSCRSLFFFVLLPHVRSPGGKKKKKK